MLTKQGIDISFAQGLDTKTDPKRVSMGNFLSLQNTVFNKGGLLQKRNGYGQLASLPDNSSTYLTTLNGNLTAVGTSIAAYNSSNSSWVSKGSIQPLSISTLPLLRNNLNQTACDSAVASNGLVCTVYLESNAGSVTNKYVIANSVTGQNITAPAVIPVTSGTVSGGMRVFVLGNNFIIVFTNTITASPHLQYIAVSTNNPTMVSANTDFAIGYAPSTTLSFDGVVVNDKLYIAYDTTVGGQSIKTLILSTSLTQVIGTTFAGSIATMMTLAADMTIPATPTIYISFYDSASSTGYTAAIDQNTFVIMAPVLIIASGTILNLASAAQNGSVQVFAEVSNAYSFDGSIPTNFIDSVFVTALTSTVSAVTTTIRSVGLASKAFIVDGVVYFLAVYVSPFQPTYFLINGSSLSSAPIIAAKLAYENGGGYLLKGLPSVTITNGNFAQIAYLFKDLIAAVNKNTAVPAGSQVLGIYSQTGINLASFEIGSQSLDTAEISSVLHLSGGFLWMYDGYLPVEHNFFLWPDTDQTTPTDTASYNVTGGTMVAKPDGSTNTNAYYYQFTYEWTDNVGNAYRSAPSIPIPVTTSGSASTGSVTIHIPTLRLTYKTANPVKIVIYRWSVAQQEYYQVTSITSPLLNNTTIDSVTFTDTLPDSAILGNNLLYTTGGVVEDVNAPASNLMTLYDTRLWLVDAEDPNLLWFSKQVIEATPVEMSDLFTMFIAPTTGAQGSTGPITAIAPLDDKLIIFKQNAIYYVNGSGPDNTGANNQYSQPIFITATVGCSNQQSIVFMPQGLMFQSDKGIWLLDRSLNTSYIGAQVEQFNAGRVESAQNIPETNQVRFILDSGITLMYDYFYSQWGTFTNVPAISATLFENMHTFIDNLGRVFQETVGQYVDGSIPVLMQFTTGPLRLDALQSYQRAYFFYILGQYITPHKLQVSVSYDYSTQPAHSVLISPNNFAPNYGAGTSSSPYGQGTPYGGSSTLEQWRVFLNRQRCQAFAIEVQEIYDSTYGVPAGAGLTISGLNVICGFKSKFRTISAANSVG